MRQLRGEGRQPHNFYYEAPVLILLSAEDGFKWSKVDAGIAVQNMALAAESLGLGSLTIGCIYDAMHGTKKEYFSRMISSEKRIFGELDFLPSNCYVMEVGS